MAYNEEVDSYVDVQGDELKNGVGDGLSWRLCFVWRADGAYEVEIIDDH